MKLKSFSRVLVFFCLALLVLGVLFLTTSGRLRVVIGYSMQPTYQPGDILILQPLREEITPAMIISYQMTNRLITHRVLAVEGDHLITQGDNNDSPDPWRVPASAVIGTPVLRVPLLGHVLNFAQRPIGWITFVILPVLWLVAGEIRSILSALRQRQAAPRPEE
ncbi:MAG: signal peptidase I [Chloroflexi bacterium]|nr:signal peptidase I [Chloroflexota bacterium]